MLLRSFLIIVSLVSCTALIAFSRYRYAPLICTPLLLIGTVLLVGREPEPKISNPAKEDYVCESEKKHFGDDDSRAIVLHASADGSPPTSYLSLSSTKWNETKASTRNRIVSPVLRRSLSYILPRSESWDKGALRGDSDERGRPTRLVERSAAEFVSLLSGKRDPGAEKLEKVPSLTAEEVNQLADDFIARFHEHMRLERQESNRRAEEAMKRQNSYKQLQAMLERYAS